jgi:hypothetical protein
MSQSTGVSSANKCVHACSFTSDLRLHKDDGEHTEKAHTFPPNVSAGKRQISIVIHGHADFTVSYFQEKVFRQNMRALWSLRV